MARKITGLHIEVGPNEPVVDVDTAVMQLLDELAQRPRMRAALATLINHSAQMLAETTRPWFVREQEPPVQREIEHINYTTHVIVLKPLETQSEEEDNRNEPGNDT